MHQGIPRQIKVMIAPASPSVKKFVALNRGIAVRGFNRNTCESTPSYRSNEAHDVEKAQPPRR